MKVLVLLFLVAAASAAPRADLVLTNSIDQLVRQTFEYARWLLQRNKPFRIDDIRDRRLVDDDVDIVFTTTDVKLSNAETFTIDKISNDLPSLHASFAITIPKAHVTGNYDVKGTVAGKAVSGSGTFVADVEQFYQSGDVQFEISADHSFQIQTLALDYNLSSFKINFAGLNVEGFTEAQVNAFLNTQLLGYLQAHKNIVVQKSAEHVIADINPILEGHSLQDVLNFLKMVVQTTPDPPPNPFQKH